MKIGVSSYSFQTLLKRGMTYFEACQHARDMGYDGIEFIDLDLAFAPGEDNVESLAKHLRAHCEALDLDIPAYTVAADFLNGRGGAPEDEPARVCRCVDIAALLGAKVLRHDAFWRLGELRDWREGVARVVPGIRQVADYAQSLGIRTCTENHGRIMQDSDRVEYLIRAVDHPNYGVVPVRACVHILQNAGYDGYLSVEFEGREETLPALENAREYLRKLLG